MHIGLIIYGRLDTVSGGYLYDRKLVEYLRRQGDTVEIVSLPWQGYGRHLLHNFSADLRRRLVNGRFDLLLQDELNHPSLFLLNGWLRRRVNYPLVGIVHHLRVSEARAAWQNALYRPIEHRYLASLDGFIFNSETTRQVVFDLTAENAEKKPFVVAPPAGDRFEFDITEDGVAMRARAAGPLQVVFVGNVIARKGLHTLLAALARLPRADWRLAVVGDTAVDPRYFTSLQPQLAKLGENVRLYGRLPDAELADVIRQSHVLAVPSNYEGFGIVYLEAMGAGLPAIATTAGAAGEIISNGVDGWLIAPDDDAALTRHLAQLHTNRDQLAQMGQAALARWRHHPTWAESMARVRQFLVDSW